MLPPTPLTQLGLTLTLWKEVAVHCREVSVSGGSKRQGSILLPDHRVLQRTALLRCSCLACVVGLAWCSHDIIAWSSCCHGAGASIHHGFLKDLEG